MDLNLLNYHDPLEEYPWKDEINSLLTWLKDKDTSTKCFCFDMVMSLAYIDSTSGLERYIELCPSLPKPYNGHLGFINMWEQAKRAYIFNKFVHPIKDRYINPREAACLQDFPLDWEFCGNLGQIHKQIGNAVPVKLATAIAKEVANYFRKQNKSFKKI